MGLSYGAILWNTATSGCSIKEAGMRTQTPSIATNDYEVSIGPFHTFGGQWTGEPGTIVPMQSVKLRIAVIASAASAIGLLIYQLVG